MAGGWISLSPYSLTWMSLYLVDIMITVMVAEAAVFQLVTSVTLYEAIAKYAVRY